MIDFHVHPKHSIDSHAEAEDMVLSAINAGLKAICFTTHIDLNPLRCGVDLFMRVDGRLKVLNDSAVRSYIAEIAELKNRYAGQIQVWQGFELSYLLHYDSIARSFVAKYPADFVLGAVHCLDSLAVTSGGEATSYFRVTDVVTAAESYCEALKALARSRIFTTIAHVDGMKKYARGTYGDRIDREMEARLPSVFEVFAREGAGIEINTSAMRKGHPDFYPSRKVLEMARDAGVRVNSIGSDAHRACDVGFKLDEALTLIREVGIGIGEPLKSFFIE